MKALFIVQGEGRGHMTQALALEEILKKGGHEVSDIIIGTCSRREIPAFFKSKSSANLHKVKSPNFYFDKSHKSIQLKKTLINNTLLIPKFFGELFKIHNICKDVKPDVIINFYDVLGGFYFLLYRPKIKRICLAHQYLASHSTFPFDEEFPIQKSLFKLNNFLTSFAAHKTLALSFQDLPKERKKQFIVPPLLRSEVLSLAPKHGDYILAYVVNKGYGQDIIDWHFRNQKVKIHCFWDNHDKPEEWSPRPNLTFHHINDQKFLEKMAGCAGYISTAGFESICEALYLEKPIMMVPVEGQYEQRCNALDAEKSDVGIQSNSFNISLLLNYITQKGSKNNNFKAWADSANHIFLKELEELLPIDETKRDLIELKPSWVISNKLRLR